MKTIRLLLAAIVLAACSFSASAGEIFRFGPRIGTEVNSMRLNSDVFNSDNRAGFTGGLMMEVNVPLVGIAFDLSVMYVHRLNNNMSRRRSHPSVFSSVSRQLLTLGWLNLY